MFGVIVHSTYYTSRAVMALMLHPPTMWRQIVQDIELCGQQLRQTPLEDALRRFKTGIENDELDRRSQQGDGPHGHFYAHCVFTLFFPVFLRTVASNERSLMQLKLGFMFLILKIAL